VGAGAVDPEQGHAAPRQAGVRAENPHSGVVPRGRPEALLLVAVRGVAGEGGRERRIGIGVVTPLAFVARAHRLHGVDDVVQVGQVALRVSAH